MMKLFRIVLLLVISLNCALAQKAELYSRAKVYLDNSNHTIRDLSSLGVAVDHGEYKKNTFFVTDFSAHEIKAIRKAGFKVEIIIKDVSKHYRNQNKKKVNTANKTTTSTDCNPGPAMGVPSHFHLGTYGGYFTYTEMLSILDSMHTLYPGLISGRNAIDTFHSIEGRSIYWVRVSNNPSTEQPAKPQMLYTALHHAREPGSISSTIYYLWYLLEHYSTDPEIKTIIDNTELYFVPCINPDGYIYNITASPTGGSMWRKNRRHNSDGTYGVDLNRNYGYFFAFDNIGSSPTTSSDTYRGTAGFSEPETQAIKWLSEQHHFKVNLNYHTYGNDIIYPWGYVGSLLTPDSAQFSSYGEYLTEHTLYRYGTGDQTVGYVTNGDSDDWMYGDTTGKPKIYAMTPETGLAEFGFYAPMSNIIPDCQNNLRTNINAATLLLPFAKITTTDEKILTQPTGHLHYTLERLGFPDTATFTVTMTSLDSRLTITGGPQTFSTLTMLQKVADSMSYTIAATTPNGQLLKYELKLYNGLYYTRDTVSFYYGKYYQNIVPITNSIADWTTSDWGACTAYYHSAPASLGSSTGCANYSDNTESTMQLTQSVDLIYASQAYLYYYCRWGIESSYDYLVVEAAPTGSSSFNPLCGKFTKPGTPSQLHHEPIYDGQQPAWVQEEIDLHDYIGQKIDIRFSMVSDAAVNYPGFYIDDMNIISVLDSSILAVNAQNSTTTGISVYPNPATDQLTVFVSGYHFNHALQAGIYDYLGRRVMDVTLNSTSTTIPLNNMPTGIYYLKTNNADAQFPVVKIEVGR